MPVFKCKMCGGTIEVNGNETVGVCEYCGSKQTLPRLDDDKKANLYDRADHYRRNNDYDKAMGIYEQILDEDKTDAEAYWSLVLCRYGIEYVEDPSTHKRIPTINRAQFTSVLADEDYKSALKYADISQKIIYEQEAKTIDDIQKGILQISSKEDPFDVFICYKETDNNGRKTQDSVLATDLYHQLTQEGFKVFFSRITLEDKLGTAYEPYIFAALNSAMVMVVLGTRKEYFNAVWVKNEWSRYLSLVKQSNGKKVLIPAYRDMDPYDLPEEFLHLQAQDMSKLGFMQDLIRGIKKIIDFSKPKETVVVNKTNNSNGSPLLERAFMFLEDGNWQKADEYCEKVLDQEPKNAKAYLGKLLAELKLRNISKLFDGSIYDAIDSKILFQNIDSETLFQNNVYFLLKKYDSYNKAVKYADEGLRKTLLDCPKDSAINLARRLENECFSVTQYDRLIRLYEMIPGDYALEIKRISDTRNEETYNEGVIYMACANYVCASDCFKLLIEYGGYKDANKLYLKCKEETKKQAKRREEEAKRREEAEKEEAKRREEARKEEVKRREEAEKEEAKRRIYNKAKEIRESSEWDKEEASQLFESISGFRDADEQAKACIEENKKFYGRDVCEFGSYPQGENGEVKPIEWIVLAKKGDKALLISKYALDLKTYKEAKKWLNEEFAKEAFSSDDKMSETKNISISKINKVFILRKQEAEKYFGDFECSICRATAFAHAHNIKHYSIDSFVNWWLCRKYGLLNFYARVAIFIIPLIASIITLIKLYILRVTDDHPLGVLLLYSVLGGYVFFYPSYVRYKLYEKWGSDPVMNNSGNIEFVCDTHFFDGEYKYAYVRPAMWVKL